MRWEKFALCLIVLVVVMNFFAGPAVARQSSTEPLVKVLLEERVATIRVSGEMEILGYSAPLPFTGEKVFTRDNLRVPLRILSQSGYLSVNGDPYRGEILIKPIQDGLMVINQVALDEYLYGVLPSEISPTWPMESLKAQAVAARCYALVQIQTRKYADFHLYDDLRSQVYYGVRKESARTTEAVDKTRGVVAVHNGEIIQAYFFAAAGGKTANSEDVWGTKLPYLKSVSDFDAQSPYNDWRVKLTLQELRKKLETNGIEIGMPTQIVVLDRDASNRIRTVQIIGDAGQVTISGSKLRFMLNLKSTSFSIVGVAAVERQSMPKSPEKKPVAAASEGVTNSATSIVDLTPVVQATELSESDLLETEVLTDLPSPDAQVDGNSSLLEALNAVIPASGDQSATTSDNSSDQAGSVPDGIQTNTGQDAGGIQTPSGLSANGMPTTGLPSDGMQTNTRQEAGGVQTPSGLSPNGMPTTSGLPSDGMQTNTGQEAGGVQTPSGLPADEMPTTPGLPTGGVQTNVGEATDVVQTNTQQIVDMVSNALQTPPVSPMTVAKTTDPTVLEFIGSGYGHGVGLSQWGAKELALKGADYKQILLHYYQGVQIIRLYE